MPMMAHEGSPDALVAPLCSVWIDPRLFLSSCMIWFVFPMVDFMRTAAKSYICNFFSRVCDVNSELDGFVLRRRFCDRVG